MWENVEVITDIRWTMKEEDRAMLQVKRGTPFTDASGAITGFREKEWEDVEFAEPEVDESCGAEEESGADWTPLYENLPRQDVWVETKTSTGHVVTACRRHDGWRLMNEDGSFYKASTYFMERVTHWRK